MERLKTTVQDGHALKRGPGRPSHAAKALEEARKAGELLVVATLEQWNAAVKKEAEELQKRPKSGKWPEAGGRTAGYSKNTEDMQSNRKRPGTAAKRKDEAIGTKLRMAEHMKELKKVCAKPSEWKALCCKTYSKTWKTLKLILDGEEEWRERMKELKIGYGSTGSTAAKGTCSKGGRFLKKGGVGARRRGAGRKDKFWHLKMQVKAFLETERSRCHHVDKVDLVEEFVDYAKQELELVNERIAYAAAPEGDEGKNDSGEENKEAAERNEGKEDAGEKNKEPAEEAAQKKEGAKNIVRKSTHELLQLATSGDFEEKIAAGFEGLRSSAEHVESLSPEELEEWQELLKNIIKRLNESVKYRESFGNRLLDNVGGKLMQPGRMTTLSMEEEEAGVKATWKEFDAALWLAAFGEEEDLMKLVASPEEFITHREDTVIGFSDQIPVWVKIGRGKQVYCGDELKKRKNTADFKEMQQNKKRAALDDEEEKKKPAEEAAEEKEAGDEVTVNVQEILVEDPNAVLDDEDVEQKIEEVSGGEGLN